MVSISGASKEYRRPTAAGGEFRSFFCPDCGTSVFWNTDKHPHMTGIAVGAIADPTYPAPIRSVWEESMHKWISIDPASEHHPQGRPPS
jgi:hypothetical protein